jgi:enoyl-CoA hydratase/carnithine racemase
MHIMALDYGNGQTFEVEYLGTDRTDLDRRLAEHQRLIASPEYDAWVKTAMELAKQIAKNGPVAIQAAKAAIDDGLAAADMTQALEIECQCYERVLPTADRLEGLAAFKEGRPAVYKGE